jgi:hypothetical protein
VSENQIPIRGTKKGAQNHLLTFHQNAQIFPATNILRPGTLPRSVHDANMLRICFLAKLLPDFSTQEQSASFQLLAQSIALLGSGMFLPIEDPHAFVRYRGS